MTKLPWKWFDHRTDLPRWLLADIGQIVVEWAVLEREFEELIRILMDAHIQLGRIISKGMNLRARITVATNLMQGHVYDDKLSPTFLKEFTVLATRIAESTQAQRDRFAHGLWDKRGKNEWEILRLADGRGVPPQTNMTKLSRAVLPQTEKATHKAMAEVAHLIVADAKELESFCTRIASALAPLKNAPPKYSRRRPARKS